MTTFFRSVLMCLVGAMNAGCIVNSSNALPDGGIPSANRAVIVYGVKVEGAWPHPAFPLDLAEYDIGQQNITGNCFRFNRTETRVSPLPGTVKYVAFDVRPGYYIYSPFNVAPFAVEVVSFEARAGKTVYIGDFIYEKSRQVSLVRQLDTAREAIVQALPKLKGQITLATATAATRPRAFVCTP